MIVFSHTRRFESWLRLADLLLVLGLWVAAYCFPPSLMSTEGYITGAAWYAGMMLAGGQNPLYLFPRYRILFSMALSSVSAWAAGLLWAGGGLNWYLHGLRGSWQTWSTKGGLLSLGVLIVGGLLIRLVVAQFFRRPAMQLIPCLLPEAFGPLLDELARHPHIIVEAPLAAPAAPLPARRAGYPIYLIVSDLRVSEAEFAAFSPLFSRVDVVDISEFYETLLGKVAVIPSPQGWLLPQPLRVPSPTRELLKRVSDLAVVLLTAPISLPILALAALAIKLSSSGPIFYHQQRLGQYGCPYQLLKLRTMVTDAEATGPQWTRAGDPRVTPLGRTLRFLAIDELPQLWNVLRGEMSLIGPRPERPELVERLQREVPFYQARLLAPPGVSGWAQLHQGGDMTLEDVAHKLRYDLYYLKYGSFALDCRILLGTLQMLLHLAKPAPRAQLAPPADVPATAGRV